MSKPVKTTKSRDAATKAPAKPAPASNTYAMRETVESIVIAFVLAFLFRTFEAEAFVIPTGSMAPTLMGRHKDVDCLKCGYRYRVTASEEDDDHKERAQLLHHRPVATEGEIAEAIRGLDIMAGVCPICRFPMPMRSDGLPPDILDTTDAVKLQHSFNGDRILVNKYLYTFTDPERWDVVVFHFPGNAEQNYIKRLVGLPNETLRVFQGDLHVGPEGATNDDEFKITRKPPSKLLAVRQLVHDTSYDPAELFQAGWPLRWQATTPTGADGWQVATESKGDDIAQRYTVDRSRGGESWLRYFHRVPNDRAWRIVSDWKRAGKLDTAAVFPEDVLRSQLIMDFNAYNTRVTRREAGADRNLWPEEFKLGVHWVGDLMVEADVEVAEPTGALLLDLVEAGKHFTARIDLATGRATLEIDGLEGFAPTAQTGLSKAGDYHVALANVDDQLHLWIDGDLIEFDSETTYDAVSVFGERHIQPHTSGPNRTDLDLSPAGVGADGAKLAVTRLQVWRDIYYIADSWKRRQEFGGGGPISDYDRPTPEKVAALRYDPSLWGEFSRRRPEDFPLGDDQFFVMGDNSPESSDARLWLDPASDGSRPGGAYLQRDLLIGKAVCVYWPRAAYSLPGIRIPIWPNFKDMRLVR